MSLGSRSPLRVAGMGTFSGSVNTGQVGVTLGGQQVFTSFSGIIADTVLYSGAGRFDAVVQLNAATSGRFVTFYDGAYAAVTSGGPFSTSGHKIVGFLPAGQTLLISGQSLPFVDGVVKTFGFPFFNGLIAAATGGSGGPSFTCTFSPEASGMPQIP